MLSFPAQNLPNEVFENILLFLDFPDFFALQQTSKDIHKKIRDIFRGHFYGKLFPHNKQRAFFAFRIPKNPTMDYAKRWFELAQKETSSLSPLPVKKFLNLKERFTLDEKDGDLAHPLHQPLSFEELLSIKEIKDAEEKKKEKMQVSFFTPHYSLNFLKSYCIYYALFQEYLHVEGLKNNINPPYEMIEGFYRKTKNRKQMLEFLKTACSPSDFAHEVLNFCNEKYLKNSLSNFLKKDFTFVLRPEVLLFYKLETVEISKSVTEIQKQELLKNLQKVSYKIFKKMDKPEKEKFNELELFLKSIP